MSRKDGETLSRRKVQDTLDPMKEFYANAIGHGSNQYHLHYERNLDYIMGESRGERSRDDEDGDKNPRIDEFGYK